MPLIGTILKHSLEHRDNTVETLKTHEREQNRVLRRLLRTAVNTQFGVYYDF